MLDNIVEGEVGQREHLAGIVDPSRKKALPPVASDHVHMYLPDKASIEAAQAWFATLFGAQSFSDTRGRSPASRNSATLRYRGAWPDNSEKPLPTKGRALDHIGF
jgi:hypothetical protein